MPTISTKNALATTTTNSFKDETVTLTMTPDRKRSQQGQKGKHEARFWETYNGQNSHTY